MRDAKVREYKPECISLDSVFPNSRTLQAVIEVIDNRRPISGDSSEYSG